MEASREAKTGSMKLKPGDRVVLRLDLGVGTFEVEARCVELGKGVQRLRKWNDTQVVVPRMLTVSLGGHEENTD